MAKYQNENNENDSVPSMSVENNIPGNGIDEALYQHVVEKLKCSPTETSHSIVPPIEDENENMFSDMLEGYGNIYNPNNKYMFWFLVIVVIVLLYLLYQYSRSASAGSMRASIMGYSAY